MADMTLRTLERTALFDPQEAVRLLRARVRLGLVSSTDLALALHLGDPFVCAALDRPPVRIERLCAWARAFKRWGQGSCIRVALEVVRLALQHGRWSYVTNWELLHHEDAARLTQAWLERPTPARRRRLRVEQPQHALRRIVDARSAKVASRLTGNLVHRLYPRIEHLAPEERIRASARAHLRPRELDLLRGGSRPVGSTS